LHPVRSLPRYCARIHPCVEARLAFTGAYDGVIRVWDWHDVVRQKGGEVDLVGELTLHSSHVNALCFDDQGRKMISADADGEVSE
jgi:WD40 repeat protein